MGSTSISVKNQSNKTKMTAANSNKAPNMQSRLPSSSLSSMPANNGFYQISTDGVEDIITERSAISKNVSNTNGVFNNEYD